MIGGDTDPLITGRAGNENINSEVCLVIVSTHGPTVVSYNVLTTLTTWDVVRM